MRGLVKMKRMSSPLFTKQELSYFDKHNKLSNESEMIE